MAERLKKVPLWYKAASAVTIASLAACQLGKRFGSVTPPPEGTKTPPPTETIPPIDQASETKIFAGMYIGEAGIGRVSSLVQNENPDSVYLAEVKDRSFEALKTGDPNLDPERIKVYAFEMHGETGNVSFPLISVSDKDNPDKLLSVFAGFGVDANGVLVPPKGGKIAVLLRLITIQSESESGLVYVGVQSREDPSAIYLPALFEVKQSADEIYFIPPYADSLGQSVPVRGGKYLFSPKPVESTPEGLNFLPAGIIAVRNTDGSWGVGIDEGSQTKAIPGILVDTVGFHLAFDGGQIDIATAEIAKRLKAGQDSPLQVYNKEKTAILFGYDAENKTWVDAAKVLSPDRNPENFIHFETLDSLINFFKSGVEKMVLLPFDPNKTYFPPLDKIFIDFDNIDNNLGDPDAEYNHYTPFGSLPEGMDSPFRIVNIVILDKNEGRQYDSLIFTEQVYNPSDGSFSPFHFGPNEIDSPVVIIEGIPFYTESGRILLPSYHMFNRDILSPTYHSLITYLQGIGYMDSSGNQPQIEQLVREWLNTGHVPPELETIPLIKDVYTLK